MRYYQLLRPLLFKLPAETAHDLAMVAIKRGMLRQSSFEIDSSLCQNLWGIDFKHPLGLAAGLDKNAAALGGLLGQGFAFVEAGTVTPRPQSGNPKPRLFRLEEDSAIINRMGFNNDGAEVFAANVERFYASGGKGVVGINIGRNKDGGMEDYANLARKFADIASYMVVNISSPNTPGLRDMQKPEVMAELLSEVLTEIKGRVPLLVKLAPDINEADLEQMAATLLGLNISGVILTNTTISRPNSLKSTHRGESGGLSGEPVKQLSHGQLQKFYRLTGGRIPIIGVGGISSAIDAYARICAGASLVQIYSALIYKGFGLVREIVEGLPLLLQRDGFRNISEAIGSKA